MSALHCVGMFLRCWARFVAVESQSGKQLAVCPLVRLQVEWPTAAPDLAPPRVDPILPAMFLSLSALYGGSDYRELVLHLARARGSDLCILIKDHCKTLCMATFGCLLYHKLRWWLECRQSFERRAFVGDCDMPFCTHCSPWLLDARERHMDSSTYQKKCLIPVRCERCSWGWHLPEYNELEFQIDNQTYQALMSYSAASLGKLKDPHYPLCNALDHEYSTLKAFLQHHISTLSRMEASATTLWCRWTRAYRLATPWLPFKSEAVATAAGARVGGLRGFTPELLRLRRIWHFAMEYGVYPTVAVVKGSYAVFDRYRPKGAEGPRIQDTVEELSEMSIRSGVISMRAQQRDIMPSQMAPIHHTPAGGEPAETISYADPAAVVCGPILETATVFSTCSESTKTTASDTRLEPQRDADGKLLKFDPTCDEGRRMKQFFDCLERYVFTYDAIEKARREVCGSGPWFENKIGKFSASEVEKAVESLMQWSVVGKTQHPTATVKLESIVKDGKQARLVMDCGQRMFVLSHVVGEIFSHVLFSKDVGLFYNMSIKGRPRDQVLDRFLHEMSDPFTKHINRPEPDVETVFVELDQTGMEAHNATHRGSGPYAFVTQILAKILGKLIRSSTMPLAHLMDTKLEADKSGNWAVTFRVDSVKSVNFKFELPWMRLASGEMLTSARNFITEVAVVLCSLTARPEHIFAKNRKTQKFFIAEGNFDWRFPSTPMRVEKDGPLAEHELMLRFYCEGDDTGGIGSRFLIHNLKEITERTERLGFRPKWDFIISGRGEFIGTHFPIVDGKVSRTLPHLPAVSRYVSKMGLHVARNAQPQDTVARFLSLAQMYRNRVDFLCLAFQKSAEIMIEDHKLTMAETIDVKAYSEVSRVLNIEGLHTLQWIKDALDQLRTTRGPTGDAQKQMVEMSLKKKLTSVEWGKLHCLPEAIERRLHHEDIYGFLPNRIFSGAN